MRESTRIASLRVALGAGILLMLLWGAFSLLLPRASFEIAAPAGERYTNFDEYTTIFSGALILTWVPAGLVALRSPLRHPGVLQAYAAAMAILGLAGSTLPSS